MVIAFYEVVYKDLNGLLVYLEKNFKQYLNLDENLTLQCHEEFAREIKSNLRQIQNGLQRRGIDRDLIQIVSEPFENLKTASTAISYRKRTYLRALLFEILSNVINVNPGITTEQFCNLLLSLNYNNIRFINYLIGQYR